MPVTDSMTAFARGQIQTANVNFCWEIKSVNHRYLDVIFRLPENWRFLEGELRALLRDKINRGKLECQLKLEEKSTASQQLVINESLVDALLQAAERLAVTRQLPHNLSVSTLLTWPGVMQMPQPDPEQSRETLLNLFQTTLNQLQQARSAEGQALQSQIQSRLDSMKHQISAARSLTVTYTLQVKDKLLTRLRDININVDAVRVEQELALMLTRMDVNEELDRLELHVQEVCRIVQDEKNAGRRLDFLMQELNREANTLAAKSDSVPLTQIAVEMKVLIEQMREQIQNIE